MSAPLLSTVESVDRLNSWVRADSFRRVFFSTALRKRIYAAKRDAIVAIDHSRDYLAEHRPLTTLVKCRDCDGSGLYTDWSGREYPHCWACENSGTRRLHFVETAFTHIASAASFYWHSPRLNWPLSSDRLGVETTAGEWSVNAPGRELTIDEAARDLNMIDEALPVRQCLCDRREETCLMHYTLFLGRVKSPCAHCGREVTQDEANAHRCHKRIGQAEFTFVACPECYKATPGGKHLFEVSLPPQLIEPENVRLWWERNERCKREGRAA